MAIDTIKFKRGTKNKLDKLSYGEPAFISDEGELYIGTESGVEKLTRNKEVEELSSQLAHNAKEIEENSSNIDFILSPKSEKFKIITFIDDDCKANFFNIWKPVCDANNIKITLACVSDWIDKKENGVMTLEQLKSLYDNGFDIASHSFTHDERIFRSGVSSATDTEIHQEFKQSKDWFKCKGFGNVNNIIYPYGNFGVDFTRIKTIAKRFYNVGVDSLGDINKAPHDNMKIGRIFLNKNTDISVVKGKINEMKNEDWLIFGTHSNDSEISSSYLNDLITYIKSQNIQILTLSEALRYKRNAISIGDFDSNDSKFFVSNNGNVIMNSKHKYVEGIRKINSKWTVEPMRERIIIDEEMNLLNCNICLSDVNKTGTYLQDEVMIEISNFATNDHKMYCYPCTVICDEGIVTVGHFWVEVNDKGTTVRMVNSSNKSSIRWIFFNFTITK